MKIDQEKDNSGASRGYAGYFITSKNLKIYLRSTKEFIVATWLSSLETENITLLGEWYFGDYRPDFRILINNKLRFVIEVKDNKKSASTYLEKYRQTFLDMGVHYIVIYSHRHFSKIIKKFSIDVDVWKKNAIYDYSGENSPTYGKKHSIETRLKIGEKTRIRCQNEEYLSNLKIKQKEGYTLDVRKRISESRKKYSQLQREEKNKKDPFITVNCVYCGTSKKLRKSLSNKLIFCDARCASPYYKKIGKSRKFTSEEKIERMRRNLFSFAQKIYSHYNQTINSSLIKLAKQESIIHNNAQLSDISILKYFGSYENLNLEIMKGKNGKSN